MRTLHHDSMARKPKGEETGKKADSPSKRRLGPALAAAILVSAPLALASCGPDCALPDGCETRDFELSLAEGEERETVTDGAVLRIKVLDIYQTVAVDGAVTCKVTGSGATISLRVESDPPFEQQLTLGPSRCFALSSSCMSINDVEITQDLGPLDSETGTCEVSNERVNFTLEIGI